MKRINLSIILMAVFLSACATSLHSVDKDKLSSVKDQMFHVRSVTIPCYGLQYFSHAFQGCLKDCQLSVLNSIPTEDILRILSGSYGILTVNDKLEIDSEITNLLSAAVSNSAGRCFSMRSNTANANSIDIEYTISTETIPHRITTGYEITVLTSKVVLIKHRDEMEQFLCPSPGYCFSESIEFIKDNARKIPSALERDIKAYQSSSKP